TVRPGKIRRLSGTRPTPRRAMSCGARRVTSRPSNSMAPRHGFRKPMAVFISVVLPMPFLPSSATASPLRTSSDTPNKIGVAPYPAWTSRMRNISVITAAEIRFDHARVAANGRGRALGDLLAEVQHGHAVRDTHHDRHVVLDQQQREPPLEHDLADQRGGL